jgi:hypothetical protein
MGGQLRERVESWSNFAFGAPAKDSDTFLLHRFQLHTDFHFGEHFRVYGEFLNALSTDRDLPGGKRPTDVDSADLLNLFVDLKADSAGVNWTLRAGRQELAFGKQRLVSPLPWANSYRKWDGVSLIGSFNDWKAHAFATHFVPTDKYDFNESDEDEAFFGIYVTYKKNFDIYYLGRLQDANDRIPMDNDRHTIGIRYGDKLGDTGFDYEVEGAYQFGDVGAYDVSAFMVGSQLGYSLADNIWSPRLWVGFDFGSGDDNPGAAFDQLYPLGHAYLGYIDIVGRRNIIAASIGVDLKPMPKMGFKVGNHFFWRENTKDALYNAGGSVVRPGAASSDSFVGVETDVLMTYKFSPHITGLLGYSHFFTGDFINNSGKSEDIDFAYTQLQFTF